MRGASGTIEEGRMHAADPPNSTNPSQNAFQLEEGEEKTEDDIATDLSKYPEKKGDELSQQQPPALRGTTSVLAVGKTIDDTFRLTRQNLTAIPAAVADGFWYTKDRVEETGGVMLHTTTELVDVRNWRCIAISGLLTCSFYTCLIVTIPVVIIIALVLTIWKHDKDGGKFVGNITEPF